MGELYINNFHIILTLITIAVVIGVVLGICAYSTFLERKVAGWVQDRKGPNRVGPFGLLQPIADGLKFLLKEGVIPKNVDRFFYLAAPSIALIMALMAFAVVPFGPTSVPNETVQRAWPQTVAEEEKTEAAFTAAKTTFDHEYQFVIAPGLDIGIVYVFALGSLNIYAIILGGWSSNNKYSLLGSLRACSQVISYEIPMGMSILGAAAIVGSLNLERIIAYQTPSGAGGVWLIVYQPLAGILFITAVFAECNRVPFDLPECEQELVAGYHTEYSGMKFAMFFLGEYTHMITTSFLVVLVFFGGWSMFGLETVLSDGMGSIILKLMIFGGKMLGFIVFYMMVRWTLPRFRFDQLMGLAWKVLLPLLLGNLLAVLVVKQFGLHPWVLFPISFLLLVGAGYYTLTLPIAPTKKTPLAA